MPEATRATPGIPADTRERILRAAEGLFMERGFADTSLRMITARAQVNLAAVNYHFGSKEALIREVFQRHLGPLNAARLAYLDRLETQAGGRPLGVEQIVEAIVAPVLQVGRDPVKGGARFLRLLGRALSEGTDALQGVLPEHYREVVVSFKAALVRALPDVPESEIVWRMHFMFGAMAYAFAGNDAMQLIATCQVEGADDAEAVIRHLAPFLTAGLQAPQAVAAPLVVQTQTHPQPSPPGSSPGQALEGEGARGLQTRSRLLKDSSGASL
jgi:AcrR family transcriptional regulator